MQNSMSLKKAAYISAFSKFTIIFMNILFSAILARVLTPEDYGVMAIITIFTVLFSRLADIGLGTAVIQFNDLEKEDIENIYTFTIYMGIAISLLFVFIGKPIAIFYNNNSYMNLSKILSISLFFNIINTIPNAILLKNKEFIKIAIKTIVANLLGFAIAIVLAILGVKYYALVFQSIATAIIIFFWNLVSVKIKIKLKIKSYSIKKVWKFSSFQFVFNIVNYIETNFDNLLISGYLGSTALAYYDKAYKLISYPVNNLAGILTPILHPILPKRENKFFDLFTILLDLQKILSLMAMFISIVFCCCSKELIYIFYGKQWINVVPIFNILSLSIYPKIMMSITGAFYCTTGNTKLLFKAGLINAVFTGGFILVGIFLKQSIEFVAIGVSVANWINFIITFYILIKLLLKQSLLKFWQNCYSDIIMLFFSIIVTNSMTNYFHINYILLFLLKLILLLLLIIIYLLVSKQFQFIIKLLPKNRRKKI